MQVLRVQLRGWTASFRIPNFAVGIHPTLPLPPLSTLYGLVSAAKGEPVTPKDCALGFVFQSSGEAFDLEVTYEIYSGLTTKSNVTTRQILFEPQLWLYLSDLTLQDAFWRPRHPLLLGRSTELVQVVAVEKIDLETRADQRVGQTLVPFGAAPLSGTLQALPTHFTLDFPRQSVGVQPWLLVREWQRLAQPLPYDEQNDWAVWMHGQSQ